MLCSLNSLYPLDSYLCKFVSLFKFIESWTIFIWNLWRRTVFAYHVLQSLCVHWRSLHWRKCSVCIAVQVFNSVGCFTVDGIADSFASFGLLASEETMLWLARKYYYYYFENYFYYHWNHQLTWSVLKGPMAMNMEAEAAVVLDGEHRS